MSKVFVAYARDDVQLVKRFLDTLRRKTDIDFWFAEDELLPGEDIRPQLKRAILNTDSFMFCVSPNVVPKSRASYISEERNLALKRMLEEPSFQIHLVHIAEGGVVPSEFASIEDVDLSSPKKRLANMSDFLNRLEEQGE